jgi:hypothetical protein
MDRGGPRNIVPLLRRTENDPYTRSFVISPGQISVSVLDTDRANGPAWNRVVSLQAAA